jgi:hypothetical protein
MYRIDPSTGDATYVAQVDLNVTAMVEMNGRSYAFEAVLDGFDLTDNFPLAPTHWRFSTL